MNAVRILTLLLGISGALNIGLVVGIIAHLAGARMAQAILTGAGAAATIMAIFFAAISAYH